MSTTPPRIVISGVTSFRNRGVEALVSCTVRELRQRMPAASFTILDRAPDFDGPRLRAGGDARFLLDGTLHRLHGSRIRRTANFLLPRLDKAARLAEAAIAGATALISTGGDLFCSEYGHRSLLGHLEPLRIARRLGVPFYFHAQSIGPFSNEADRRVFLETARHAAGISVRERISWEYLTDELGFAPEKVLHAADPAFLLPPAADAEGERLFQHFQGGGGGRPVVALSISQAISLWSHAEPGRHLDTWQEVIAWLRRELDADIILIPHVQENHDGNNDVLPATTLLRRCGWDPRVRLAGGDLSAADFKAILSRCDFVIAERMHAAIAALSSGVPVLSIGYSIKARGILNDLLGPELTRDKGLISFPDFLAPGAAVSRVREAWESRAETAAALRASLPEAKRRAAGAFDILSQLPARA